MDFAGGVRTVEAMASDDHRRPIAGRSTASGLVLSVLVAAVVAAFALTPGRTHDGGIAARLTDATTAPAGHAVVALGDSVPAGSVCGCRPFPQIYGSMLHRRTGGPVSVDNLAVGGLDTAGLIAQLGRTPYESAVRRSDIVLITIGANDFNDHRHQVVSGSCERGNADCVADELTALRRHLATALARIRALRGGAPTTVLVTGYWNVFKDGDVAIRQVGKSGLEASRRLTRRANRVIRSVTTADGGCYVDLFAAFQRAGQSITDLMAGDGDHPDAAGHRLIARALIAAGLPRST
jgi:lysophospholipase L1-like esterase